MKGRVVVRLKPEVLDPQGTTVAQALANLGYEEVADVRQGKVFDVELDTDDPDEARERLEEMAEELLANPVIEVFDVEVRGATGDAASPAAGVADALSDDDGYEGPERRGGGDRRSGEDRRGDDDRRAAERRSDEASPGRIARRLGGETDEEDDSGEARAAEGDDDEDRERRSGRDRRRRERRGVDRRRGEGRREGE